MTRKQTLIAGLALALAVSMAGEALARGGKGRGAMDGQGKQGRSQTAASTTPTRPEGSQRRDGTFQSTGTTANGATTRPGNGRGLQDGSHLSTPTITTGTTAPTAQ